MAGRIETLWIPEKPSVAKELTAALTRVRKARVTNQSTIIKDGFYQLDSGDVVCSVFGHMLRMLPPSRYLTKEQNINPMSALPLIPETFKFEPIPEMGRDGKVVMKGNKQVPSVRFEILERLIKQSKKIVNACDIDREGQLIFNELVQYVGRDPNTADVLRTSIVSMTPDALEEAVRKLDPNGDPKWARRGAAAASRQEMDWLLGMNASMAYQVVTNIRTMSVGRVQTPVLSLVVRRDLEIENFKPQIYYVPVIVMEDGTRMRWEKRHGADTQPGFDPNGRIIDLSVAQEIITKIQQGLDGIVKIASADEKAEAPPLPFSMGSLQSEAAKAHGLSVAEVTKAAQNLYEKHKSITYVGTDCRYMPEAMHEKAGDIISKLAETFAGPASGANPRLKSRAFNDKKIDEHFAIVPTGIVPQLSSGDRAEQAVYESICRRYLAQFYPDYRALLGVLAIEFGQDEFRATAKKEIEIGWKAVDGRGSKGDEAADAQAVEIEVRVPPARSTRST